MKPIWKKSAAVPFGLAESPCSLASGWFWTHQHACPCVTHFSRVFTMKTAARSPPLVSSTSLAFAIPRLSAKSLQLCPTLCNPMDCSQPGFSVHGILQARTLEWVATSFSNAWKWKVKVKSLSHVWLLVTPWTAAHQAPPSMGFSGQQSWSGVPLPSPS